MGWLQQKFQASESVSVMLSREEPSWPSCWSAQEGQKSQPQSQQLLSSRLVPHLYLAVQGQKDCSHSRHENISGWALIRTALLLECLVVCKRRLAGCAQNLIAPDAICDAFLSLAMSHAPHVTSHPLHVILLHETQNMSASPAP